jgi:hypothetical protein
MTGEPDDRFFADDTPEASRVLEAALARAAAATGAPWWVEESGRTWQLHGAGRIIPAFMAGGTVMIPAQVVSHQIVKAAKHDPRYAEYWPSPENAAFIVASRTDVPRLAAALTRALALHTRYVIPRHGTAKAVCTYCQGRPLWPCGTVKIITEELTRNDTP